MDVNENTNRRITNYSEKKLLNHTEQIYTLEIMTKEQRIEAAQKRIEELSKLISEWTKK